MKSEDCTQPLCRYNISVVCVSNWTSVLGAQFFFLVASYSAIASHTHSNHIHYYDWMEWKLGRVRKLSDGNMQISRFLNNWILFPFLFLLFFRTSTKKVKKLAFYFCLGMWSQLLAWFCTSSSSSFLYSISKYLMLFLYVPFFHFFTKNLYFSNFFFLCSIYVKKTAFRSSLILFGNWLQTIFFYWILFSFSFCRQWQSTCTSMLTYLLYNTISGRHIWSDGTWSIWTPPYSFGSHRNL